jgi:hypothetical protein
MRFGTCLSVRRCSFEQWTESKVASHTKRELWFVALSALAAAPFIACVGMVVVSGIVAW